MKLNIVGGTYYEICKDPVWYELFGSGLRAAQAISDRNAKVIFHTYIGKADYDSLLCICNAINIELNATIIPDTYSFIYEHPLANPHFIIPEEKYQTPVIEDDLFLQFGALEGKHKIQAQKVVYDPQSGTPISFWENGSLTQELIWVANFNEVKAFTKLVDFEDIKNYLFTTEKISAAVIKKGSDGAVLIQKNKEDVIIPVFKSKSVWPIGTGDIYSSTFAYNYLIEGLTLEQAAIKASLSTAYYAQSVFLPIPINIDEEKFEKFFKRVKGVKKVYLAGPFFTMAQRWLVGQFRDQLKNFGLDVFSPYHEVGYGPAEIVAPLDINAIKTSDLIVAIVDGLDSGTLFEIGYARALSIPVLVYVESEKKEALTMLEGLNCKIESDFSTIIYKAVWAT